MGPCFDNLKVLFTLLHLYMSIQFSRFFCSRIVFGSNIITIIIIYNIIIKLIVKRASGSIVDRTSISQLSYRFRTKLTDLKGQTTPQLALKKIKLDLVIHVYK